MTREPDYNELCSELRLKLGVQGVALFVWDEDASRDGFGVDAHMPLLITIPARMRKLAETIDRKRGAEPVQRRRRHGPPRR